jgi:hypothetical protein
MTIALQGNAQGGIIQADGVAAANVSSASGLPFCKNKLFNGEVTRINQRAFDGNWATKNIWASGNTIAQQELCYGYDMWAKASATDMVQPIEAGNYRPSTVHTISGLNMTTRQETSPASGNWNIVVPQAARNVQVEEGLVATPFEIRPISFELTQCQRYYEPTQFSVEGAGYATGVSRGCAYFVTKRVSPYIVANYAYTNGSGGSIDRVFPSTVRVNFTVASNANSGISADLKISAVI